MIAPRPKPKPQDPAKKRKTPERLAKMAERHRTKEFKEKTKRKKRVKRVHEREVEQLKSQGKIGKRVYVRLLGARAMDEIERSLLDPDLISMRTELARIDFRLAEIHEKHARGETKAGWELLQHQIPELLTLLQQKPTAKREEQVVRLLGSMNAIVHGSLKDYSHWDEVSELIELRRKVADTERKFEELREHLVSLSSLAMFMDDLYNVILLVIKDREVRWALLTKLGERLNAVPNKTPIALPLGPNYSPPKPVEAEEVSSATDA